MKIRAAHGFSTLHASLDVETFSEAGYTWVNNKRTGKGLKDVGAAAYAAHPTTEVTLACYDLADGKGPRLWMQGCPPPEELFEFIRGGGVIEVQTTFEVDIWREVCAKRMGWPKWPAFQVRDLIVKSLTHSVPGKLSEVCKALKTTIQKQKSGTRLINRYCVPRTPTKKDPRRRIRMTDPGETVDAALFAEYNIFDVRSQMEVSRRLPDLPPDELELWFLDQEINRRGVHIDTEMLTHCEAIVERAFALYETELGPLTGGIITTGGQTERIKAFLAARGVDLPDLKAPTVKEAIEEHGDDMDPVCLRVLQIRKVLGSASVKKLFAIRAQMVGGRLRNLFQMCGADRTDRWAGRGPQPQNLPANGPPVAKCEHGHYFGKFHAVCPWCGSTVVKPAEWNFTAVSYARRVIATGILAKVEYCFGDAVKTVSGCLRSLFCAAPGNELICSDFSAIEAVCLAELAGEQWRIDVFNTHGKIYEMSAAKITGIPFEEFLKHKEETGEHHPMRKKIGKVAELASGYAGWIGAWKNFGAEKHFDNDRDIRDAVLAWRKESPAIVEFWGGQWRERTPEGTHWNDRVFEQEYYGIEGAAVQACLNYGQPFSYRSITFGVHDGVLYCLLPSGRTLKYHDPKLALKVSPYSKKPIWEISYMGWNSASNKKKGLARGWVRMTTYGGKLTENITQAVARDILAFAMRNVAAAGYNIVLHVHDELAVEVPAGTGSVEEVERLMGTMAEWCKDWPVFARGGWRGLNYRKD